MTMRMHTSQNIFMTRHTTGMLHILYHYIRASAVTLYLVVNFMILSHSAVTGSLFATILGCSNWGTRLLFRDSVPAVLTPQSLSRLQTHEELELLTIRKV